MILGVMELAPMSYLVVGTLAFVVAWLTWRSYNNTGNIKLMFVFTAFFAIGLKSVFVLLHEWLHVVESHHDVIVVMGLFDVIIVLLFFVPFLAPRKTSSE